MKPFLILMLILCTPCALFSSDIVCLRDGKTITGEVAAYSSMGEITIRNEDQSLSSFPSRDVLSIEKLEPTRDSNQSINDPFIHFHAGVNKLFEYTPPRYTYRGTSYNMETEWGMPTDTAEFFAFLQEEHPDLDARTLRLIQELKKAQKRQNTSMGMAGLMVGTGTIMTFLPLNLDDIQATPSWGKVVSVSGFSLNVIGVGILISNLFVHQGEYPKLISDSFNAFISSNTSGIQDFF